MTETTPHYPVRRGRASRPTSEASAELARLADEDELAVHLLRRFLAEMRLQPRDGARRETIRGPRLSTPEDVFTLVRADLEMLRQEQLRVLTMTTRHELMDAHLIYQGTLNGMTVRLAEVFRPAIVESAAAIIAVHNHPSGDPTPSPEDVRLSRSMRAAGILLGIDVVDHIIVGHERYTSLRERGVMEGEMPAWLEGGERL